MQNRYLGDVGDFGKFYLLNQLIPTKLKLGVNWFLVDNEVSKKTANDGKLKIHLYPKLKDINKLTETLYYSLVNESRKDSNELDVIFFETSSLRENTTYFSQKLNDNDRDKWLEESLTKLKESNVIFCDPDNGFETKTKNKKKHTRFAEVKKYIDEGKSVIVYQHAQRKKFEKHRDEILTSLKSSGIEIAEDFIKIFYIGSNGLGRGGGRYYYLIMHQNHKSDFETQIKNLESGVTNKVIEIKK